MADPNANTKQGYHQFKFVAVECGKTYTDERGSFEVFWYEKQAEDETESGWYWWACFPGCLPDGEPSGPYATSQEAYDNAQEDA